MLYAMLFAACWLLFAVVLVWWICVMATNICNTDGVTGNPMESKYDSSIYNSLTKCPALVLLARFTGSIEVGSLLPGTNISSVKDAQSTVYSASFSAFQPQSTCYFIYQCQREMHGMALGEWGGDLCSIWYESGGFTQGAIRNNAITNPPFPPALIAIDYLCSKACTMWDLPTTEWSQEILKLIGTETFDSRCFFGFASQADISPCIDRRESSLQIEVFWPPCTIFLREPMTVISALSGTPCKLTNIWISPRRSYTDRNKLQTSTIIVTLLKWMAP